MWVWGGKVKNFTIFFFFIFLILTKLHILFDNRWLRSFEEVINVILFLRPTTYDERAQAMTNGIRAPA